MAQPASILNTRGQSTDTLYTEAGDPIGKLGLAPVTPAGITPDFGAQQIATHVDGETFDAGDPSVVIAGVDSSGTPTVVPIAVDSAGRVVVGTRGVLTDAANLDLDTTNTSQSLFSANPDRKYLIIQNLDTAEEMWVNFGASANKDKPSLRIDPLGALEFGAGGGFVPTESVAVIATTAGHKWSAKEG